MALDPTRLSTAICSALVADARSGFSDPLSEEQQGMVRAWTDAIAAAVVAEIQTNAVVVVESVSGVTPGGGVSGPGTGKVL